MVGNQMRWPEITAHETMPSRKGGHRWRPWTRYWTKSTKLPQRSVNMLRRLNTLGDFRLPFCLASLFVFVAYCATVPTGTFGCEGIQIRSDELTIFEAEKYCHYAVGERKKVE